MLGKSQEERRNREYEVIGKRLKNSYKGTEEIKNFQSRVYVSPPGL